MMIQDFSKMELNLKQENKTSSTSTHAIPALMQLLSDAKELLFDKNGKYRKLQIYQPRRIWKLAKTTIKLINTLMAIFGK